MWRDNDVTVETDIHVYLIHLFAYNTIAEFLRIRFGNDLLVGVNPIHGSKLNSEKGTMYRYSGIEGLWLQSTKVALFNVGVWIKNKHEHAYTMVRHKREKQ